MRSAWQRIVHKYPHWKQVQAYLTAVGEPKAATLTSLASALLSSSTDVTDLVVYVFRRVTSNPRARKPSSARKRWFWSLQWIFRIVIRYRILREWSLYRTSSQHCLGETIKGLWLVQYIKGLNTLFKRVHPSKCFLSAVCPSKHALQARLSVNSFLNPVYPSTRYL